MCADRQEPMMPRKSPGHDSRVITYRTLPGSSPQYQRVNVGQCTAWVQTKLAFELEVRVPDETTETKPYTQSQVSRAVKRVDDWLEAIKANPPVRRAKRTVAADPCLNEPRPKMPASGKRAVRKVLDDRDD